VAAAVLALALVAAACTSAPSPQGWAPPQPVTVASQQLVIAAHKGHLFALPPDVTSAKWQFPPQDKNAFPIASVAADALDAQVDKLSISSGDKDSLHTKIGALAVQGPTVSDLKAAVKATSASNDEKSRLTDAIDAATKATKDAINSPQAFYGDIGVSPDSKTLYAAAFRGYVYALDAATGRIIWVNAVGSEMIGGIAVSKDGKTVYYGSKGKEIFARDAATGAPVWTFDARGEVWSTPTIAGDTIYATSLDGTLYALDPSGKARWTFRRANAGIAGAATVEGDAVYVGAFDNKLYSVKTSDGTENWSVKADNWFWGAPRVQDGTVYAANLDGRVYAVNVADGKLKWGKPFDTGSPVRSSPAFAGGGLVVANKAGRVYKLDESAGTAIGNPYVSGSTIYANLTADSSGKVYVSPQAAQLIVLDATNELQVSQLYGLAQ